MAHIITRILHDARHEAALGAQVYVPAALVVNALRNCGLLDALRPVAPTRVGKRPLFVKAARLSVLAARSLGRVLDSVWMCVAHRGSPHSTVN